MMIHIIKFICAFVLAVLPLSANAVKIIVHNQAHYLVSFEIQSLDWKTQIYHSGNFGIGQTREIDIGSIESYSHLVVNWLPGLPGLIWQSQNDPTHNIKWQPDSIYEIFFWGDVFNPKLGAREQVGENPQSTWAYIYRQECYGYGLDTTCCWKEDGVWKDGMRQ